MIARGVVDGPIGFIHSPVTCGLAYDMSRGVIGIVSRILHMALTRAHRDGRMTPTIDDLKMGYYGWLDNEDRGKQKRYDPFASGVQKETTLALNQCGTSTQLADA